MTMKKLLTTVLAGVLMLCGTHAYAQISVGGGFTHSIFIGPERTFGVNYSGFYLGASYDVAFAELEGLTFEPGGYYYYFKHNNHKPIPDMFMHFLEIPLYFKYTFPLVDDFSIAAITGPRVNLGFAGNTFRKGVEIGDISTGDGVRAFDISWGIGTAVTYSNSIQLRLLYDLGMVYSFRDTKMYRNQISVGLAFIFQ